MSEADYYGSRFREDREKVLRQIADDVRVMDNNGKVLWLLNARLGFFGGLSFMPAHMKDPFVQYVERALIGLPATTDPPKAATVESIRFVVWAIESRYITLTEEQGRALVAILNIGAKSEV